MKMSEPKGKTCDLVVIGGTPGGIAAAIRAAREGLQVLLTHYHEHLGGLLSSGLGALDTQYGGKRAPILGEFCERLIDHYRDTYGADSKEFKICFHRGHSKSWEIEKERGGEFVENVDEGEVASLPNGNGYYYGRMRFEAKVAESIVDEMVDAEERIEVRKNCYPVAVDRVDRCLTAVYLKSFGESERLRVEAGAFIDASYEGDLMAVAGAPYRIGRESRTEFNEMHAGRIFTALHFAENWTMGYPREAVEGKLNLEPYQVISQQVLAGSTGEGDEKIQAYNFRVNLCADPKNQVMPEKPDDYRPEDYLALKERWGVGMVLPNDKRGWNAANLPGGAYDYPDGDWETRNEIARRHKDHAIGMLYFLQHDETVPAPLREQFKQLGLAADEFQDNGNFPYEMYVREGRRLEGRFMLKESDCTLAPGLGRAPVFADSIAIGEWTMDSHSVSFEKMFCGRHEGKVLLTEMTRPSQIPYRTILPPNIDNLLVPVCLSATHIAWGTVRLEPTWMHICESAAHAVALARAEGILPADVDTDRLQRRLVRNGVMVSFFNEFDMAENATWAPAVQYLGAKGFFASYDARPNDPLTREVAEIWVRSWGDAREDRLDVMDVAWHVQKAGNSAETLTGAEFVGMLEEESSRRDRGAFDFSAAEKTASSTLENTVSRGEACQVLYESLA